MENTPQKNAFSVRKYLPRILAIALLIAVAASAFTFGVGKLFSAESGYRTVECTASEANCAADFIFTYQLGLSGRSPTAELRAITDLYNEKAVYYYRLFHASEPFADVMNVAALNAAPNTPVEIPAPLFSALKKMGEDAGRNLFLGPIFAYYETLFASSFDEDAADWDPAENPSLKAEYQKTLAFAADDRHIRLDLAKNGTAQLVVSDEYLAYAKEVGIVTFIDFYWLKNAFIADCIAEDMCAAGFYNGAVSARDGYIRNTAPGDGSYTYDFLDERGGKLTALGKLTYSGKASICSLRPFILDDTERQFLYIYGNGRRVTRYISGTDGLSRTGGALTVYSADRSCADLLLSVLPYYMEDRISEYEQKDVGVLYSNGETVTHTPADGFLYTEN
ncbi:MAG: hypothetical protein IJK02_09655 [Clostridia bacterium]|nr:hypothetical protein [Clostridia bacterium]